MGDPCFVHAHRPHDGRGVLPRVLVRQAEARSGRHFGETGHGKSGGGQDYGLARARQDGADHDCRDVKLTQNSDTITFYLVFTFSYA